VAGIEKEKYSGATDAGGRSDEADFLIICIYTEMENASLVSVD
jgi:hypothetical protein